MSFAPDPFAALLRRAFRELESGRRSCASRSRSRIMLLVREGLFAPGAVNDVSSMRP